MKYISIFLCLSAFSLFSGPASAYDPTTDIQNAFCNDLGPFSNAAMRHSRELINIIESIENDPACQGMFYQTKGYLNEVMAYQGDYYSDQNDNRIQGRIEFIENEIQVERAKILRNELADYLQDNPDASMQEISAEAAARGINPYSTVLVALESELGNSKIEHVQYQVDNDEFKSLRSQTSRFGKVNALQRGIDSMFSLLNTSNQCSEDNPNLFSKIGAQVLGASGSIYGGAVGSALIAGGSFLNGISNFFRNMRLRAKVRDIKAVNLAVSVGCGMEGIAKLYCQARDTKTVIKFTVEQNDDECPECKDFFQGLDLIGRQVHVYNKWITNVITGSTPSSGSQARDRIAAFSLRFKLTSSIEEIYGKIGETKTLIDNIVGGDAEVRKNEFRVGLMTSLSWFVSMAGGCRNGGGGSGCGVSDMNNPYKNSFVQDSKCGPLVYIYSNGSSRESIGRGGAESCDAFVRKVYPNVVLNLERQKELMSRLFVEAEEFVTLRIQTVFEENPMKILAKFELNDPEFNNSPKDFLHALNRYFISLLEEYEESDHPYFFGLIKTMNNRVEKALRIVSSKLCPTSNNARLLLRPEKGCLTPESQVTDIGNILAPRQETRSIESALKEIVTKDLDLKLQTDVPPKYLKYLRQVSKERSVNFFIRNYLQVHSVLQDTARSQIITRTNIGALSDLFARRFLRYLGNLKKMVDIDSDDSESRVLLAELCFQTLHAPDDSKLFKKGRLSAKSTINKVCSGLKYRSYVPKKVPHLIFNDILRQRQRKRLCQLYDFKNMLEIYQVTRDVPDADTDLMNINEELNRNSGHQPRNPYTIEFN